MKRNPAGPVAMSLLLALVWTQTPTLACREAPPAAAPPRDDYTVTIRPLLAKYCFACHATAVKKGGLDLEQFRTTAQVRREVKVWQQVLEQLHSQEMPPRKKPQPTDVERQQVVSWIRAFLEREARARVGDPGQVPLRRLSNTEYDNTIRDLTGVEMRPAREFPPDGAAGEGFTNAAEALTAVSPDLFAKYLAAAKEIADHAVLLPDGMRFSPSKTRRDWTNECTEELRRFYAATAPAEGKLHYLPYVAATLRHRDALTQGQTTLAQIAAAEKLNARYLGLLWNALTEPNATQPFGLIQARWRLASVRQAPQLAAEIASWQALLWQTVRVGNYGIPVGNTWVETSSRQAPKNPAAVPSVPLRLTSKPQPGQSDMVVRLAARELVPSPPPAKVIWRQPRFVADGKPPLLLRDYQHYGAGYEKEVAQVFTPTAAYLSAAAQGAQDPARSLDDLARQHGLDPALLKRWAAVLALEVPARETDPLRIGRAVAAVPFELLDHRVERIANKPHLNGWKGKSSDLPVALSNASDTLEQIPGKIGPHRVAVHPTPTRYVGVTWTSPIAAKVRVAPQIAHVHPACGNSVAWWLEHRRGDGARVLAEGTLEMGGAAAPLPKPLQLERGDLLLLAVDAKQGDHTCDMTEIDLILTEVDPPGRTWTLSADVAGDMLAGNPHADRQGQARVWSFVQGPSRPVEASVPSPVPAGSVLAQWREAAADPSRTAEATALARRVQDLLAGTRPERGPEPDRVLYDRLVAVDGPLLTGWDPARLGTSPSARACGLPADRFTPAGDVIAPAVDTIEMRLPVWLLRDRTFLVDVEVESGSGAHAVQVHLQAGAAPASAHWDGASPVLAAPDGAGFRRLRAGFDEFRNLFPLFLCFPNVVPNDEVVTLKTFHREDEPLRRLFLNPEQQARLNRMWREHTFISQQPLQENVALQQFIQYVTQDGTKEALAFFQSQRAPFARRAEAFARQLTAAEPRHVEAAVDFAERAFRRPLTAAERSGLVRFYQTLRGQGADHTEAICGLLVRTLVAPAFLFRMEIAPPGAQPAPINDWELATRLSYFLWASLPDDELRRLARENRLGDPEVLAQQVRRMLQDPRVRALAVEFGTQWIHVRGFDEFNEKNEQLFPAFTPELKRAMYEEAIRFFQDLWQRNQPALALLDADATWLNETLARHYGIPGVVGPEFRRVDGVKKFGRGGLLGLGAVHAKQAGASRTSPILRGNWVVETLLGEKLPKPPPDVPQLPDTEGGADRLTMRQRVERHTSVPECATCHQRIDPFGFALERYDPIGRRRAVDLGGLPIDATARLKDGTAFADLDGLRTYLLAHKQDVIVRLFCRRLLGYALGRAVTLSDTQVLEEMAAVLQAQGGVAEAILVIVRSPQFRQVRGSAHGD